MKSINNKDMQVLQLFSEEKLSEFKHMSLRARLQWLEVANRLVNKVGGPKRRKAPTKPPCPR
jgi:hypothetical protein